MMTDREIRVMLVSDLEHEELVAEMYVDDRFVALLNQDAGLDSLVIEFASANDKEEAVLRQLPLSTFNAVLEQAIAKLEPG